MKNLLVCLAILAITTTALSQSTYGFNAGLTSGSIKLKDQGIGVTTASTLGFTAGIYFNHVISEDLNLQTQINYVQKGGEVKQNNAVIRLNYLEVPVNAIITYKKLLIGAGPTFNYGLNGRYGSAELNFGSGSGANRFELCGNILAGYQFTDFINVTINHSFALTNMVAESDTKWFNRYFAFKLAYKLSPEVRDNYRKKK